MSKKLPIGNSKELIIRSTAELGAFLQGTRKLQELTQLEIAGLGNTGNRVIVDIENGKPTTQIQKVLDYANLLGLELVVRQKGGAQ